jgi:hypothetical protein
MRSYSQNTYSPSHCSSFSRLPNRNPSSAKQTARQHAHTKKKLKYPERKTSLHGTRLFTVQMSAVRRPASHSIRNKKSPAEGVPGFQATCKRGFHISTSSAQPQPSSLFIPKGEKGRLNCNLTSVLLRNFKTTGTQVRARSHEIGQKQGNSQKNKSSIMLALDTYPSCSAPPGLACPSAPDPANLAHFARNLLLSYMTTDCIEGVCSLRKRIYRT